jgi:YbbR domain-containing protein
VAVPAGVEVMWVDPAEVTLTLEAAGMAVLPIKPAVDGQPARGFAVGSIAVDPEKVTLAGPQSRLRAATAATTEPVSIAGASAPVSAVVAVSPMDAELRLREPLAARVTVMIVPEAQVNARTFASRPVALRNLGAGWQATAVPADVSVTVRLTSTAKDGIDERRVVPFVDLVGLGPGQYTLPVRIEPAQEFTVSTVSPVAVSVRIH